jgi:hypothetical protein
VLSPTAAGEGADRREEDTAAAVLLGCGVGGEMEWL